MKRVVVIVACVMAVSWGGGLHQDESGQALGVPGNRHLAGGPEAGECHLEGLEPVDLDPPGPGGGVIRCRMGVRRAFVLGDAEREDHPEGNAQMSFADDEIPTDPKELGRQCLDLLDQVRAGARLVVEGREPMNSSPVPGQEGLFLVLDHDGVLIAAVQDEREFDRVRVRRIIEVLASEIPRAMQPELQLALASRKLREIMPRFQMIRP